MAGHQDTAAWIAEKLMEDSNYAGTELLGDGFLRVVREKRAFTAAATRINNVVELADVKPLFKVKGRKPEFVVNVPSKTIWSGKAIGYIHDAPAAFGTLSDLHRAARISSPATYRFKEYAFYERVFQQHSAVFNVTRLYDRKFKLNRVGDLPDIVVVLLDAYHVGAEHVRNAREIYGTFDVALKMTAYGSITSAAIEAAESMGSEAINLKQLMSRLRRK